MFCVFTTAMYRGKISHIIKIKLLGDFDCCPIYSCFVVVNSLFNVSIVLCFLCPSFAVQYLVSFLVLQLDH